MWGTTVNALAIVAGSLLGLLLRRGLPEGVKDTVLQAVGLGVLLVGTRMAMQTDQLLVVLISLVMGGIAGELVGIEAFLDRLGKKLEVRLGQNGNGQVGKGFVFATLLYCVGAMAIMGALESGLTGRHDILYAKSLLDGITAIMLTSSMGIGVAFSAVPVFLYQGGITLVASSVERFLTDPVIREMTATGGVLIIGISLNMLGIKSVRVGNMLPAILVAMVIVSLMP